MEVKKARLIIDGVCIPTVAYIGITLLISIVYGIINGTDNLNAILIQGIADIFVILTLVPLYVKFKKKYNVPTGKFEKKQILYITAISFSVCIICNIIIPYLPFEENDVSKEIFELMDEHSIWLSILFVAIFIPIVEEIIFRGFMYDTANILFGTIPAIIITSIIFGVVHFNMQQGIYGVIAGFFLAYVRYKYGRVINTIIMHLIMNFCSLTFVGPIQLIKDKREILFIILICLTILFSTLYRMNMKNNN